MSFGFSAGDFIAAGKLIAQIATCLQEVGGAKSDFQDLIRELETLRTALDHLDRLPSGIGSQTELDSIKYSALTCRVQLEQFWNKIQKYRKTLGASSTSGVVRAASDKIKWSFNHKEEVAKLRWYLNGHVNAINLLLAEHGLHTLDLANKRSEDDANDIRNRITQSQSILQTLKGSFSGQVQAINQTHTLIKRLLEYVRGDFQTSWNSFGDMIKKVSVSSQQIYAVVLEIRTSMSSIDTRWTYLQHPIIVEDALGLKFPLPSEYDYGTLDNIIRYRFRDGRGSRAVQAGSYEIYDRSFSQNALTASSQLTPGSQILMAIIVLHEAPNTMQCPMLHCRSQTTSQNGSGLRICDQCGSSFGQSLNPFEALLTAASLGSHAQHEDCSPKRLWTLEEFEGPECGRIRNVRLAAGDQGTSVSGNSSGDEDLSDGVGQIFPMIDIDWSEWDKIMAETERSDITFEHPLSLQHPRQQGFLRPPTDFGPASSDTPDGPNEYMSNPGAQLPSADTSMAPERGPVEFEEARTYVNKIQKRFAPQSSVYQTFLEILQTYRSESLSIEEVYQQLMILFHGHQDIQQGLKDFVPNSSFTTFARPDALSTNTGTGTGKQLGVKKYPGPRNIGNASLYGKDVDDTDLEHADVKDMNDGLQDPIPSDIISTKRMLDDVESLDDTPRSHRPSKVPKRT